MSQLKKGALLSYITIFLTNIVGLLITPFIIKSLGDAEYGLYTLIGAFVGYIGVLDLGLNNTIVRFVAKYKAEKDKKGEENFLAITAGIYGIITLVILLIGIFLYYNLDTIFSESLTVNELGKAKIMFIILIFNVAVTIPGGAFEAICTAYEHFVYPKKMRIIRYIVRTIAVFGILYLGSDAIGLVILDTIMNLSIIISNGLYVFRKLNVRFKFNKFDKKLIKQIFTYTFWVFLIVLVYQFQWKAGQMILGINTDTITVAVYAIGIFLGSYYATFATSITSMFLPKAMKMIINNASGEELSNISIKIGRITIFVLFLILGGFVLFGQEFIELWVGKTYANSWIIGIIIMLTLTNSLSQSFLTSVLKAMNLYRFKSLTYIIFVVFGLYLGYLLMNVYNEVGMILGICIGVSISQLILNFYFIKKLDFKILRFYYEVFLRNSIYFIVILLLGFFINIIYPNYNWIGLFIKIILFSLVYSLISYFFIFNRYEKGLFNNLIKKIVVITKSIK